MKCKECGKEFELKEEEKQFFIDKKLEIPKRCKECRIKRRIGRQWAENSK